MRHPTTSAGSLLAACATAVLLFFTAPGAQAKPPTTNTLAVTTTTTNAVSTTVTSTTTVTTKPTTSSTSTSTSSTTTTTLPVVSAKCVDDCNAARSSCELKPMPGDASAAACAYNVCDGLCYLCLADCYIATIQLTGAPSALWPVSEACSQALSGSDGLFWQQQADVTLKAKKCI